MRQQQLAGCPCRAHNSPGLPRQTLRLGHRHRHRPRRRRCRSSSRTRPPTSPPRASTTSWGSSLATWCVVLACALMNHALLAAVHAERARVCCVCGSEGVPRLTGARRGTQVESCKDTRAAREALYKKLESAGHDVGRRIAETCVVSGVVVRARVVRRLTPSVRPAAALRPG